MNKKLLKKLIGTSAFFSIIMFFVLGGFSYAKAQYIEMTRTVVLDGYVSSVSGTGFEMYNSGVDAVSLKVNSKTVFTGNLILADIQPGDWIKVVATDNNGNITAKVVRRENGSGYGHSGRPVFVDRAKVISKTENHLVVKSDVTTIDFIISSNTKFHNISLSGLKLGDTVTIIGTDSGTDFLAKHVTKIDDKKKEKKDR